MKRLIYLRNNGLHQHIRFDNGLNFLAQIYQNLFSVIRFSEEAFIDIMTESSSSFLCHHGEQNSRGKGCDLFRSIVTGVDSEQYDCCSDNEYGHNLKALNCAFRESILQPLPKNDSNVQCTMNHNDICDSK